MAKDTLRYSEIDWSSPARPAVELGVESRLSSQYFEFRLAPGQEQVDYLFAVHPAAARRTVDRLRNLAEQREVAEFSSIARLIERWTTVHGPLAVRVPTLWFEYDAFLSASASAVPSISLCITPGYSARRPLIERDPMDLAVACEALDLLDVNAATTGRSLLQPAFDELPDGARIIHVSAMLGRDPKAVKLYGVLDRGELIPYLERLGWAGNFRSLEFALAELYPANLLGRELYFDLNLENLRNPVRASLGLAVSQQHVLRGPDRDPSRLRVLDAWTNAALCDPQKVKDVRAWLDSPASRSEARLANAPRLLDVKLTWHEDLGYCAKAYLGSLFPVRLPARPPSPEQGPRFAEQRRL